MWASMASVLALAYPPPRRSASRLRPPQGGKGRRLALIVRLFLVEDAAPGVERLTRIDALAPGAAVAPAQMIGLLPQLQSRPHGAQLIAAGVLGDGELAEGVGHRGSDHGDAVIGHD